MSMSKITPDDILESLYNLRIRESDQIKTVLELYDLEIHQKISKPDYQTLKTMVKRSIDQKLRLRNFDARNEKIETGAVVTSRRGSSGIEREKGFCYQWKAEGQCSRGDNCSFQHDEQNVQNRHQRPLRPLKHRKKKDSQRPKSIWEVCSTTV